MRERSPLVGKAASLLICGVLAGVVVAAAAFPAVAFTGLTAKQSSDSFENLPHDLKIPRSPQISYLYANDGKTLIAQLYDENRKDVPISDVAPVMRHAMVAAEDTRFYQHNGVDLQSVMRALVANGSSGEVSQGSSTLTMQYVRNVLKSDPNLSPEEREDATRDTAARKMKEIRYAVALEKRFSKKEILERYLNIAYFGHNAYGIYAASETYFSKPPSKLTAPESAMIAGLVQTPDHDPTKNSKYKAKATQRRNYVLGSMVRMGYLDKQTAAADKKKPIKLDVGRAPNGCTSVSSEHNDWGFFCDYVLRWWKKQKAFGDTQAERERNLKQGGYKIITSLDPDTQKTAMQQSLSVYDKNNPKIMPIAAVQPGTGRVLALSVNRNYSVAKNPGDQQGYPNTVAPLASGDDSLPGYQTGSTFKMFTMLAALSQKSSDGTHKFPLDTLFNAPKHLETKWYIDPNSPAACDGGHYCVENDAPSSYFYGYRNMWTGFGHSVNTFFVWLEEQVGPQKAVDMAKKLGIHFYGDPNQAASANGPASDAWLSNHADTWGAFTLGVSGTFPLNLANAYATVAADGKYCAPSPVSKIVNSKGKSLDAAKPHCHQAIDKDVARAATDAARCPVNNSPYFGKCSNGTAGDVPGIMGDHPVAGKTGTSENESTESFAGFTKQVAAAGTAADQNDPSNAVGSGVASSVDQAVAHTMATALDGKKPIDFTKESSAIAAGKDGTVKEAPATKKPKPNTHHDHHDHGGHGGHHDRPGSPNIPGLPGTGRDPDD